jgi:hypothetical protein
MHAVLTMQPSCDMTAGGRTHDVSDRLHMQEVREPLDAFQHDQLHRIMSIMGPFSESVWPGICNTTHWKRNTQHIRTPHREYQECLEAHLLRCNPTLLRDPRFTHAVDLIKQCASPPPVC